MQSRRDQVQAHMFIMGRLASGMLRADPDALDTPNSRTGRARTWGVALGVGIGVVSALYGVVFPGGGTDWKAPGTLVVVKQTGARFLYIGGSLHPVLNEASAKLLAGDRMVVDSVDAASLSSAVRGTPVGIVGAPDELPDPATMRGATWLACASQRRDESGGNAPQLTLAIEPEREGSALPKGKGVLIADPDGVRYLLWQGQRLRLDADNGAVQALGYSSVQPVQVSAAFLNAIPSGPDLAAPEVTDRGAPGPALSGQPTTVGQLFTGPAGGRYLLTTDGLVPLTRIEYMLLSGDPRTQRDAYQGGSVTTTAIGPDDLTAHTAPAGKLPRSPGDALPAKPPAPVVLDPDQSVCADLHPASAAPRLSIAVAEAMTTAGHPPTVQPGVIPSCTQADRVAVRPGGGALVRALSGAGTGSTYYLVTDAGVKFPLPTGQTAQQLGYSTSTAAGVPGALLGMLPSGPSLDPAVLANGGVVGPPASPPKCGG
ncbi:type VII secretion protein EccB [Streptomyces sp. NPDC016566]|uniref:type VII secretion protein EccB n=1 Tax=Streptomyces sp. NPDC016566 TaxID=3364967 RepID=UPI0036FB3747